MSLLRRWLLPGSLLLAAAGSFPAAPRAADARPVKTMNLALNLRARFELFKGSGEEMEATVRREVAGRETALLLCDVWDDHWCRSAARRCDAIARRIPPVLAAARAKGVFVIHAPSDCMEFYQDTPQRRLMAEAPAVDPPAAVELEEPPLPIDDSDGGCDDLPPCPTRKAWTRQHPAIPIEAEDGISDRGAEVYSALRQRGIGTLLVAGVHTNMCVLKRSFALRQMTRWGVRCILLRDLTDTMYNPRMQPHVSHEVGTELVVRHIERYVCPTALSHDLLGEEAPK